jgi:hypothetical protein
MLGHARHRRMAAEYDPPVLPLIVSGAFVALIAWLGISVYRRQQRREPYLRALAAGEVTVDEVPARVRDSLESPKHRAALAGSLRKISRDAAKVPRRRMLPNPPVTWYFREPIRAQISDLADLIERPETPAKAVALAEVLLADGESPFYGDAEEPLLRDLQRLRAACQSTAA